MSDRDPFSNGVYQGLKSLLESSFPKRCASCGRVFETAAQFVAETRDIHDARSGLVEGDDDDGRKIVELFRNCPCGSTLMTLFDDRRDGSPEGARRRQRFGELLDFLVANGFDRDTARLELIKVLHGEPSSLLERISPPGRDPSNRG